MQSLSAAAREDLGRLLELCRALCERSEHQSAIYRLARTLEGKVVQTRRWLTLDSRAPQLRQLGHEAAHALIGQATQLVDGEDLCGDDGGDASVQNFHQCCDQLRSQVDELYAMGSKPLSKIPSSVLSTSVNPVSAMHTLISSPKAKFFRQFRIVYQI